MKSVNAYDFDHTIYDGDASRDFIIYCMMRDWRLWAYAPSLAWALGLYVLGARSRKQVKEIAFRFLKRVRDVDGTVGGFWKKNERKMKRLFADTKADRNIVVSASPEFLLRPMAEALGAELIATRMNQKTGKITGKNCRGEEKVVRLRAECPSLRLAAAYSDSVSDVPLLKIAEKAYIVRKERVVSFAAYKPSPLKRFTSPEFIRFLFVGCINAFIGVFLAYSFSFFLNSPQLAFAAGFVISLVPSYVLNSIITFRDRNFSLRKFGSFVVSYIPNFLIMFFFVHVFTEALGLYPLLTYVLAVAVAVPITFILLSVFTFKSKDKQ